MATRPTKAQAKAASAKLTGQQVTELVANADPEVTGRQMEGAGVVEPSVQGAEVTRASVEDGSATYVLTRAAQNDITRLQSLYGGANAGYNSFLTNLVNVIGLQVAWFRTYTSNMSRLKRGRLDMGDVVEEIVNDLPDVHVFSPAIAETQVERREIPKVYAQYHRVNMQRFYKQTISRQEAALAFKSYAALGKLAENIISSMFSAMEMDDKALMLYMMACAALDGAFAPVTVTALTSDGGPEALLKELRTVSDNMETDETRLYNALGIYTNTPKDAQVLITTNDVKNTLDVDTLAAVFNVERAEWWGRQISTMSFSNFDWGRLEAMFTDPETGVVSSAYKKFDAGELQRLGQIEGVLFDERWFAVYEKLVEAYTRFNEQGIYMNNWLHKWDIYSYSLAANAVAFVSTAPTVTAVTVSPATPTVKPGTQQQFSAAVTGTGIYSAAVTWKVESADSGVTQLASGTTISNDGKLTVAGNEKATSLKVTATSVFNTEKAGSQTVTVSAD